MECRSDYINGTCLIWCGKIPFWYLVDGDVVLKVTGIGVEVSCGGASIEDGGQTNHGKMKR